MCLLVFAVAPAYAQTGRRVTKLVDGVYEIEHGPNAESGNTTVVIGDRQVFVVDTCFLPSAAREDIAQIRKWTDKPVSFVLNTHFHNDHNVGNRVYMDAFPALTIIAHVETKRDMDLFGPGSADRYEAGGATLQQMLDTGKNKAMARRFRRDYIKRSERCVGSARVSAGGTQDGQSLRARH